ncbi:DUF4244 domain-containing protein [Kineococcus gynurae]|uniref:DUF4244 domain-containing protein n=1 Tax=Kineococcus gynurae TaxID=452979 RepID=A0ABV5LTY1_9ACTN
MTVRAIRRTGRRTIRESEAGSRPGEPAGRELAVRPTGGAGDAGMATAEYAMVLLAAAGFAGLLAALLTSGEVRGLLTGIVRSALTLG